ncbi:MAG: FtsX-like permease family protein [Casimicrobiaceae bacterium]
MLISIAARNLVRQRTRTLLTLASVALGVASLILARGFVDDVLWQLREATIRSQLGHFQVFAPGYVDGARREPLAHTLAGPRGAIAALHAIAGVDTVAPRLSFPGSLSNGRGQVPVIVEGVDPAAEARIGTALSMVAGLPLERASGPAVIVGEGVAGALGLHPGDTITLLAATRDGALNTLDAPLAGVFRSPFKDYDAVAARIKLDDAQALVGTDSVNSLVVLLAPGTDVETAIADARHVLPSDHYDVRAWWELADFYQGTAALYRREFLVLLVIVSLMVLLSVANSIGMSLHERRGEFGTVRALGYPPATVFRQILAESLLLGACAALVGVVVGVLLAWGISAVGIAMPPPPNSELGYTATIRLSVPSLALAALVGLVASVAGAILPARRLARMPIVEALRHAV